MYGIVYLIVNKINRKRYVGQTTFSIETRFKQHCLNKRHSLISLAIKKYGKENFDIKIISRANNKEELDNREKLCIRMYATLSPNGYNLVDGGSSGKASEETRKKMSMARSKHFSNPENRKKVSERMIGKKQSRETREKRSAMFMGENNPFFGKTFKHTEEAKKKISESSKKQKGKKKVSEKQKINISNTLKKYFSDPQNLLKNSLSKTNRKEIICHQNGKIYHSIKECVKQMGFKSKSKISDVINGKLKSYKGYTFSLVSEIDIENFKIKPMERTNEDSKIKIKCNETGIVYSSIREAAIKLNLKSKSKISDVINGKLKSYKGYTFSRAETQNVL